VLRYDEELNRYVYPAGLTAFLNQTQCDKNNLDAVQTLFATESGLRSTEETLQEAARSFTEHESEHLVTFQHELENSVDLAKRFWGDNEVERSKKLLLTERVTAFGAGCHQLGLLGSQTAAGAMMLGGHARTWEGISMASQGLMQLGQAAIGFQAAQAAMTTGSMLPMMCTGVGAAVGLIMIGCSLFGKSRRGDNGLGQALQAISQQIQQLTNLVQQGFRQTFENQQRIYEAIYYGVIPRLEDIKIRLGQLESIAVEMGRDQALKSLKDAIHNMIAYHEDRAEKPDPQELKASLRDLSGWFEGDAFSCGAVTGRVLTNVEVERLTQILVSQNFTVYTMLPLVADVLSRFYPHAVSPSAVEQLPNLYAFGMATYWYMKIVAMLPEGNFQRMLKKIEDSVENIENTLLNIVNNRELWLDLMADYQTQRRAIGHQIYQIIHGSKLLTFATSDVAFGDNIKECIERTALFQTLNDMELRRQLLIVLHRLTGRNSGHLQEKIAALESKEQILNRKCTVYREHYDILANLAGRKLMENGRLADEAFYEALRMGGNLSASDA
jgi:hypothetical protein